MRDSIAPARTHAIKAELEVSYGDEEDNFLQSDNDHEVDEPPAKKRGEVKSTEDNSKKTLDIDASVGQLLERSNTSSNEEKWDPKEGKSAVLSSLKLDLQKDETGPYVDTELASIAKTLIKDGLPEEKLQDKMSKYHRPGNCENLTKVRVNQAVWDNLSPSVRSHDVKMQKVQTSLFKGMCALISMTNKLLDQISSFPVGNELLQEATDAFAFIANANIELTAVTTNTRPIAFKRVEPKLRFGGRQSKLIKEKPLELFVILTIFQGSRTKSLKVLYADS